MKKFAKMLVLTLMLSLVLETAAPVFTDNVLTVQAATAKGVKLNATKKTLTVGNTFQLKLTGTKKTATWSTSKKSVATVTKKGKVTAKAAGTATITAKVNNKKYTCKITVKAANNFLKKAPFTAKELKIGNCTAVIPKSWDMIDLSFTDDYTMMALYPHMDDLTQLTSMITIMSFPIGESVDGNIDFTKIFESKDAEATLKEEVQKQLSQGQTLKEVTVSTEKKGANTFAACKYVIDDETSGTIQMIMYINSDHNTINVVAPTTNSGDLTSIQDVVDYLLTSMTYKK